MATQELRKEQIKPLSLTNAEIAAAAAIDWTKISKAGSSLADLITRSAGDLSSGTLPTARMPALTGDVTTAAGAVATTIANSAVTDAKVAAGANIAWSKLSKAGSSLADLVTRSAADLSSGLLPDARLSSNVPLLNAANVFSANQRVNAGMGINVAPPATGSLAASGRFYENGQSFAMGEWPSYTPTFGNITVGNGTLTAKYTRVYNWITASITLIFGSTTTIGIVATISAPVGYTIRSSAQFLGEVGYFDASALTVYPGIAFAYDGASIVLYTAATPASLVSNTHPFTWTTGDEISIRLMYEGN